MRFERALGVASVAAALMVGAIAGACRDGFAPAGTIGPPDSVGATPLGMRVISLRWSAAPGASGYRIERRADLQGEFTTVRDISGFVTTFADETLEPETIYGYRVRTLSASGTVSGPSLVAGARTAPVPGIVATVATNPPELASQDGYSVAVARNGDTLRAPVAAALDQHRFSPLAPGPYRVILSGVGVNCSVHDGTERTDTVTDQGLATLRYVSFSVSCRDPHVGRLTVNVATTGDSLDADGYVLTLSGVADDATLPDSARAFFRRDTVPVQALRTFAALRPGDYTLELGGVAGNCTVQGPATQDARINALDDVSRSFAVQCRAAQDPNRPLVWRSAWFTPTPAKGEHVVLEVGLDLRARPGQDVNAVQADLGYDATVARYDSVVAQAPWQPNANSATPGVVHWLAFVNGLGKTDSVTFVRFYFTVIGDAGASFTTRTTILAATAFDGSDLTPLIRRVEAPLTVGAGATNQPPVARPGGPYGGVAGALISFNGTGSSDPDGTIASYTWDFGDGGTASGAAPTHTYAGAGTFPVSLTVTDNVGATGTATTTATVSSAGGAKPFTWRSDFGSINAADSLVTLTISLDLSTDIPQTAGPEALDSWRVDSLIWNAAVLRYFAFNFGPGGAGAVNPTDASRGKLTFNGVQGTSNNGGVITIATIKFKVVGGPGAATSTRTALGLLLGTPATGSFSYGGLTTVQEGSLSVP